MSCKDLIIFLRKILVYKRIFPPFEINFANPILSTLKLAELKKPSPRSNEILFDNASVKNDIGESLSPDEYRDLKFILLSIVNNVC